MPSTVAVSMGRFVPLPNFRREGGDLGQVVARMLCPTQILAPSVLGVRRLQRLGAGCRRLREGQVEGVVGVADVCEAGGLGEDDLLRGSCFNEHVVARPRVLL